MKFTTLDIVVRRTLLETGKPIHYYAPYLFHAGSCVRMLSKDTLQVILSKNIPINSYGAGELPDDFAGDVAVCIQVGNELAKLPVNSNITPIRQVNSSGDFVPYNSLSQSGVNGEGEIFFGFPFGAWGYYWNIDDYGSFKGGVYGARGGTDSGYQIFPQRRQIQMTEDFIGSNVILLYTGDGESADNASMVDVFAIDAIKSYIRWQMSGTADSKDSAEARKFYNERRLLRSNLSDLDCTTIRNILHNSYSAAIKQ